MLRSIFIYPVKSASGVGLREADVEERGLRHDRRWMVVDERNRFITQRAFPKLALVDARIQDGRLELSAPGMETVTVFPRLDGERVPVVVWRDTVAAARADEEGDAWFTRFLGIPCRLVFMPEDAVRPVDPDYAVNGSMVSFADGFPVLLAAEGSLQDLNARLREPMAIHRFRPNLVIAGTEPFEEDSWREIRIGSVRFHVVKPCGRCQIINVDQASGLSTKEPLRTLASYRTVNGKALFAQNLIPANTGTVRVGDEVEVIRMSIEA